MPAFTNKTISVILKIGTLGYFRYDYPSPIYVLKNSIMWIWFAENGQLGIDLNTNHSYTDRFDDFPSYSYLNKFKGSAYLFRIYATTVAASNFNTEKTVSFNYTYSSISPNGVQYYYNLTSRSSTCNGATIEATARIIVKNSGINIIIIMIIWFFLLLLFNDECAQ